MNVEGVTLKLLLHEVDKEKALAAYADLRPDYFSNSFKSVLKHIKDFYECNSHIPELRELEVFRSRDRKTLSSLASLELIDTKGVELELAIEELANQHAQNLGLDLIDSILDDITMMDRYELLDKLASVPLRLEEQLTNQNTVFSIKTLPVFKKPEDFALTKIASGICDAWDNETGGYYRQDLVLFGGKRGSGKSLVCANLVANQHKQGNVSIYCSIEMTADETLLRILGILAGVDALRIKKNELTKDDIFKLAEKMGSLFVGGEELFKEHFHANPEPDIFKYQEELYKLDEKDEGRIIIIDDQEMTLSSIDTKVTTYKAKYGDKLALVIVDYLNQLVLEDNADMYDWKPQILVAKGLKNIARKNDVCVVSPYQMDDNGATRFAKGILDPADIAQLINILDRDSGAIEFETTKARSSNDTIKNIVTMDWATLSIDPTAVSLAELEDAISSNKEKEEPELNKEQPSELI